MQSRFDTEARIAVAQAADIARELGHTRGRSRPPPARPARQRRGGRRTPPSPTTACGSTPHARSWPTHHVDPEPEPDHDADSDGDADSRPSYDEDREALQGDRHRPRPRPRRGPRPTSVRTSPTAGPPGPSGPRASDGRGRRGRGRTTTITTTTRAAAVVVPAAAARRPALLARAPGLLRDVRRSVLVDRLDDATATRRGVPGLTGARLLVALTRSEDPAVQAVLATADRPRRPAGAGRGGGHRTTV